jgi:hypothetical protein
MSTKDQTLSSELHGEALLIAKRPELQPLSPAIAIGFRHYRQHQFTMAASRVVKGAGFRPDFYLYAAFRPD